MINIVPEVCIAVALVTAEHPQAEQSKGAGIEQVFLYHY